ncbi:MAG: recombination protein RecR [Candidatus Pacebacteria bacterium]|nr:recombination protein RecR [Candidatus Paceibacterota bacterium]
MNQIEILAQLFKEFPGIGERQAKRFVYFLLHKNPTYIRELSDAIVAVKNTIKQCPSCYLFFQSERDSLCDTCRDPKTDHTSLLIIEKDADHESIKKSKNYSGMYFILGGLIPIVTKDTPNFVRVNELMRVIENRFKNEGLKEIIIALSLNPQGENTDTYIRELLNSYDGKIKISSLGRGLSTGSELEYADSETIKNALRNRS